MDIIGQAIQFGRLFQPLSYIFSLVSTSSRGLAAILNYHFAQTTLLFQISNTKKEEFD